MRRVDFTGVERVRLAAGLCGWDLTPEAPGIDLLSLSEYRWIRVRYDRLGRIVEALDHAQIGLGGPTIERMLGTAPGKAERIIGWLSILQ